MYIPKTCYDAQALLLFKLSQDHPPCTFNILMYFDFSVSPQNLVHHPLLNPFYPIQYDPCSCFLQQQLCLDTIVEQFCHIPQYTSTAAQHWSTVTVISWICPILHQLHCCCVSLTDLNSLSYWCSISCKSNVLFPNCSVCLWEGSFGYGLSWILHYWQSVVAWYSWSNNPNMCLVNSTKGGRDL